MLNRIEYPEQKINHNLETPEHISGTSKRFVDVPTMVTINEAKSITGLSYEALRKMCINNEIVHIRVGAKYLINLDKLIAKMNGDDENAK